MQKNKFNFYKSFLVSFLIIFIINKYLMNKNVTKKLMHYYLQKHGLNATNNSIKSIDNLNFMNLPEYNLESTNSYKHVRNFPVEDSFSKTFYQEVLSYVFNPEGHKNTNISKEAKELGNYYIKDIKIGAYSDSNGIQKLRQNFINYMKETRNLDIDMKSLMFTNGSLNALEHILTTICQEDDQVLIPNPFYSHARNLIKSKKMHCLEYRLNHENWNIDFLELKKIYESNKKLNPIRVLIFSNPGDTCGKVYDRSSIEKMIKFCYENKITLISWEVGMDSIINDKAEFVSTIDILNQMPKEIKNGTTVFTVLGITKRLPNFASIRSGLAFAQNLNENVLSQLIKYKSIDLCSSVYSQISFDLAIVQSFEKLFGKEFDKKFENSIKKQLKDLSETKNRVLDLIKKNPNQDYHANDIDSGNNLFTRLNYLKTNTFIEKYYRDNNNSSFNDNVIVPGKFYGSNRENYINILIDKKIDYSFLNH